MSSISAKTKKEREQGVLAAALVAARKRGGECRRLSDRIGGTIVDRGFDECPDIILCREGGRGPGRFIGVEHFRVDQLLEWNAKAGKLMSAAPRVYSRLNRLGRSVRGDESSEMNDEWHDELGSIVDELWAAEGIESLDAFVRAFSDTFNSHLAKSSSYREGVARVAGKAGEYKLAFLIETHVDYSHFRYWDGYRMSVPSDGELPLFTELVKLFGTLVGSVDYLILAMCSRFGTEVVDARIINCSSIASSLFRQKTRAVEYVGYSRSLTDLAGMYPAERKSHVEVVKGEDRATFLPLLAEGESLSDFEVFQRDMDGFMRALVLREEHKPFLATFGVSMFLELFGDYARRDLRPGIRFDLPDLVRWKDQMGSEELHARGARFREAHGIKGELLVSGELV